MNGCERAEAFDPASVKAPLNRWIVGETTRTVQAVTAALDTCGFDAAADALYRFIWRQYCDWYVELAKPLLGKPDEPPADLAAQAETRATAAWVLDVMLKLLHPVMPFLTEELWAQTANLGAPREHKEFLMVARWPDLPSSLIDPTADAEIGLIIETIEGGRSLKSDLNVPGGARLETLEVVDADPATQQIFQANSAILSTMLRVKTVTFAAAPSVANVMYIASTSANSAVLTLPVAEHIDLPAEKARLAKDIANLAADIDRTAKKLANADFVARAPEEVVEENRERLADAEAAKTKLEAALARLGAVV
jgi:valyl-tRNA synthetase